MHSSAHGETIPLLGLQSSSRVTLSVQALGCIILEPSLEKVSECERNRKHFVFGSVRNMTTGNMTIISLEYSQKQHCICNLIQVFDNKNNENIF